MDSFELNKIIAAVLLVALIIIGIGKLSDAIFYVEKPKTPGYVVEVEQTATAITETKSDTSMEKVDIAALMAMADLAHGEKFLKNVLHVTRLSKEGKIILVLHFTM